jgi:hypothetical protein
MERRENKVYVEQASGKDKKTTTLDIPEGTTFALRAPCLFSSDSFPTGAPPRGIFFMIDFSGKSVTATARQSAIERVEVPAGEFACYRMRGSFLCPRRKSQSSVLGYHRRNRTL